MIEKILSLTVETWNDIFQAVSVVAAAIAFVALVGIALTGRKVGQRQAEKILALDREVAEARTKQVEAERALLELQQAVAPRRWPNQVASAQELKRFAGVTYILEYVDKDDCPEIADLIAGTLGLAGWRIDGPYPSRDGYLTHN